MLDRVAEQAHAFDLDLDLVARAQEPWRRAREADAGRGPGGDDVADLERHERRQERHDLAHIEDHLGRGGALHRFAVHARLEAQALEVIDLVEQHELGAARCESVDRLACGPLRRLHLQVAGADVVERHDAGHGIERIRARDATAAASDDDRQLALEVQLGGGDRRDDDRRAGAHKRVAELREHGRHRRGVELGLLGVGRVVQADAEDLFGVGHRRTQDQRRGRTDGHRVRRRLGELADPIAEREDATHRREVESVARERGTGVFGVDDVAPSDHAGAPAILPRRGVADEAHYSSPPGNRPRGVSVRTSQPSSLTTTTSSMRVPPNPAFSRQGSIVMTSLARSGRSS